MPCQPFLKFYRGATLLRIFAAAVIFSIAGAGAAAAQETPKQIVEKLYRPYLADPNGEKADGPSAMELILPYASKPLRQAILRNEECERRSKGICNIDFDVIINGQAWKLSDLHLAEETDAKTLRTVVRAGFINFDKQRVSYFFVQEKKTWKIDDVETIDYAKDGKAAAPFFLMKQLLRTDI